MRFRQQVKDVQKHWQSSKTANGCGGDLTAAVDAYDAVECLKPLSLGKVTLGCLAFPLGWRLGKERQRRFYSPPQDTKTVIKAGAGLAIATTYDRDI
jgi:hypothetical protein